VAFFIGAPLVVAAITRVVILWWRGPQALERVINAFKPVMPIGLLATLVLVFIIRGKPSAASPCTSYSSWCL